MDADDGPDLADEERPAAEDLARALDEPLGLAGRLDVLDAPGEIAATCRSQAARPTSIPIANQRWLQSEIAVLIGWRMSTAQAQQAPRCLYRNARFEANAQSSARRIPS